MDLEVSRKEKKFLCARASFLRLVSRLDAALVRDAHSSGGIGYKVRSLYFDSPLERDRWEVLQGIEERRKVRMRVYSPQDKVVKLEHKYKLGDRQKKSSLSLTREEAQAVLDGRYDVLKAGTKPGAQAIYRAFQMEAYRPRILIEYDRLAWVGPMNDIRLTWDTNIRASRTEFNVFSESINWTQMLEGSVGVFEVKYNGFLCSYIEELIAPVNALPHAFSKYLLCCEL